ncbi:MAG: rRNA maturation RNase YbeY, partial [Bacteroidota bacterium]
MEAIYFFAEDIDFTLPTPDATAAWLRQVIQQEGYSLTQLNIIFCSDQYLHAYNLAYLQHDTLTDVLSFDHSDTLGTLEGDIYISIERVQENALVTQLPWLHELHMV